MESFVVWVSWVAGICAAVFLFPRWLKKRKNSEDVLSKTSSVLNEDVYSRFSVGSMPLSTAVSESRISILESEGMPVCKKSPPEDTLLILSVMAKPGMRFASYELLQAISSAGLKFGEMNIFHYIYPEADYGIKLFSLLSAEEPGEFNLDTIGDFSCPGLMLFMDYAKVPDPVTALNIMLEKAGQLADDLDGRLFADPKTPWSPEVCQMYQNKVMPTQHYAVL